MDLNRMDWKELVSNQILNILANIDKNSLLLMDLNCKLHHFYMESMSMDLNLKQINVRVYYKILIISLKREK